MKIKQRIASLVVAMIAALAPAINLAEAHQFEVALVIPRSGAAATQGAQIHEGFMLATSERDSHPGQESDGHLGGLDVYVTLIDGEGNVGDEIERLTSNGQIDILAAFGSGEQLAFIGRLLRGKEIALLLPGRTPFETPDAIGVSAFRSAYLKRYGYEPSRHAAQGYNAARRIDKAVRAGGGADDTATLTRVFLETASSFTW